MLQKIMIIPVLGQCLMTWNVASEKMTTVTELTTSIDRFSNKMFETLNYSSIPFGISGINAHLLLSMMSLGARKNTLTEMKHVLGLDKIAYTLEPYRILDECIKSSKELTLWSAIKRCEEITIVDSFLANTKRVFSALYDEEPSGCVIPGNKWIGNTIQNDLKYIHLVDAISDTPVSLISGVSSLEFYADWAYPFDPLDIHKRIHNRTDGSTLQVEYMNKIQKYASKSYLNNTIIKIPFRNKRFAFYIISSKTAKSLSALEKALNYEKFNESELFEGLIETVVNFSLPRSAFGHRIFLNSTLVKMGMKEAFSPKANFLNISDTAMFIESVFQDVSFDISDVSVLATVLTYTYMNHTMNMNNPTPYSSNEQYPFHFFIRDDHLKLNLFQGKGINSF